MRREYPPQPILAVSSVIFWDQAILMVKRGTEPSIGEWNLPGGAVELGETHKEALQREVYEETNLEIVVRDLVGVYDKIIRDSSGDIKYHYLILDYWAEVEKGSDAKASSDVIKVKWVPISQIQEMDMDNSLKEVILKATRMMQRSKSIL